MAYITYQQYKEIYGEPPVSEDNFSVYAGLASDLIDGMTQYRIEAVEYLLFLLFCKS